MGILILLSLYKCYWSTPSQTCHLRLDIIICKLKEKKQQFWQFFSFFDMTIVILISKMWKYFYLKLYSWQTDGRLDRHITSLNETPKHVLNLQTNWQNSHFISQSQPAPLVETMYVVIKRLSASYVSPISPVGVPTCIQCFVSWYTIVE